VLIDVSQPIARGAVRRFDRGAEAAAGAEILKAVSIFPSGFALIYTADFSAVAGQCILVSKCRNQHS
jgi:hypothetical protein